MMNTLDHSVTGRVLHSRGAIVECSKGHTWKATASLVSMGQYAMCGHGITSRNVHSVEPAECPQCAAMWRVIHDTPHADIVRIELNTRGVLGQVLVATQEHPAVYRMQSGRLVAGRNMATS